MLTLRILFITLLVTFSIVQTCRGDEPWTLDKMKSANAKDKVFYRSLPIDKKFINPWPIELEQDFQARAREIIEHQSKIKPKVNTYFENEKRNYGFLMAGVLSENKDHAAACLKTLQQRDHQHQEWHRETAGIDFYAAFTIKHQIRKYFYFGDLLEADYRKQMFLGGKNWTEKDPLKRPHYAYSGPKSGWGPDAKNSWVDVRSTENLFLMRVTSVYLMAEETKNESTRKKYEKIILDYIATLFRIGMGEWDSENYHGHSITPLLNLYDFAKNEKVKLAAKAGLDFFFAIGAVKYLDGGFNGPTKRDYNHIQPFGGSASNTLWVAFGGEKSTKTDHWESDEVHLITSSYRPPVAIVNLARKRFPKPVTIFSSKPPYTATTSLNRSANPTYLETQHIANSFQLGSLAGGTRPGKDDVNGFKILVKDSKVGAVVVQGVPGPDPYFVGSPKYESNKVSAENRVAQDDHVAIWLVESGKSPWRWVIPDWFEIETKDNATFVRGDKTWIAFTPLGTSSLKFDKQSTASLTKVIKKKKSTTTKIKFPNHVVLSAQGNAENYCGFAIVVGEPESFTNYSSFVKAITSATVDASQLSKGIVTYKLERGRTKSRKWLGLHWNKNPHNLGVWKNGKRHDFVDHARHLYQSSDNELIQAKWGLGSLTVQTTGNSFECSVDSDGEVTFKSISSK